MSLLGEIKRRKVFQVAVVYVVVAWAVMQVVDVINEPLNLPGWFDTVVIVLLAIGFPIALIFSWIFDLTPEGIARDRGDAGQEMVTDARSFQFGKLTFIAVIVLGALLIGNMVISLRPAPERVATPVDSGQVARFQIDLPRSVRVRDNEFRPAKISRDGRSVIFNQSIRDDSGQLYLRPLDRFDAEPISGTESANRAFALSPDGEWVAYFDLKDSVIKKVPVDGGVPTIVGDPGGRVWSLNWSSDGILAFESDSYDGLMQLAASGGTAEPLTFPLAGQVHKHPSFSQDGNVVFFTIGDRGLTVRKSDRVAALELDSREPKVLMAGASPRSTSSGQLIYFSEGALWPSSSACRRSPC